MCVLITAETYFASRWGGNLQSEQSWEVCSSIPEPQVRVSGFILSVMLWSPSTVHLKIVVIRVDKADKWPHVLEPSFIGSSICNHQKSWPYVLDWPSERNEECLCCILWQTLQTTVCKIGRFLWSHCESKRVLKSFLKVLW